ncbi:Nnf1-domain-containing protein [Bisporella sp. PMI_857]|nr:Nnf1-domain-containing protein [Bisporella sp. PMI_857]
MSSAPSPSPPPSAPTALTPGPRAAAFQTLYANALSNTLRSITYESFAACFPSIAISAPESLKSLHANFVQRLSDFASDEFQTILAERSVVASLNTLESLIASAKTRKARASDKDSPPIPPHTLPVETIIRAHTDPLRAQQQGQLNAKLQTVQSQNAALAGKLADQQREIEGLLGGLEKVVRDLENAGGLLQQEGAVLSEDARVAEEALRQT